MSKPWTPWRIVTIVFGTLLITIGFNFYHEYSYYADYVRVQEAFPMMQIDWIIATFFFIIGSFFILLGIGAIKRAGGVDKWLKLVGV